MSYSLSVCPCFHWKSKIRQYLKSSKNKQTFKCSLKKHFFVVVLRLEDYNMKLLHQNNRCMRSAFIHSKGHHFPPDRCLAALWEEDNERWKSDVVLDAIADLELCVVDDWKSISSPNFKSKKCFTVLVHRELRHLLCKTNSESGNAYPMQGRGRGGLSPVCTNTLKIQVLVDYKASPHSSSLRGSITSIKPQY